MGEFEGSPARDVRMINPQLLEILRCPRDRSVLTVASDSVVEQVNRHIAEQQATNISGQPLKKQLDGGLVRTAGDLLYPVVDGIPVMLPDEAIELSQWGDS